MFHEINRPAIGIAPFKETPQMVRPFKTAQRDPSSPPQLVLSDASASGGATMVRLEKNG